MYCIMKRLQAYGDQGMECGHLNKNVPHWLKDLNAWAPGSGIIKRNDLVGRSVLLRVGSEVLKCSNQGQCHPLFLLPAHQNVELSSTMSANMLPCFPHDNNRPSLWNCRPAPIGFSIARVAMVMEYLHSNRTLKQQTQLEEQSLLLVFS